MSSLYLQCTSTRINFLYRCILIRGFIVAALNYMRTILIHTNLHILCYSNYPCSLNHFHHSLCIIISYAASIILCIFLNSKNVLFLHSLRWLMMMACVCADHLSRLKLAWNWVSRRQKWRTQSALSFRRLELVACSVGDCVVSKCLRCTIASWLPLLVNVVIIIPDEQ